MISVVIPVYNHAHTLKKCILGLVNQTYRLLEIIIVNDGSTDDFLRTASTVEGILKTQNIEYKIINQKNAGAPAARNRGWRESKGDYVIFYDADIIAQPIMLQKMHDALTHNPTVSYSYSQFRFGWKKIKAQEFDADDLRQNNYVNTVSLIRRSALVEVFGSNNPWDENLKRFQDWDLFLTLLENNKTGVFVPEVLYGVRVSGRIGISSWLPSFIYRLPWKTTQVKKYEAAREIIARKHGLKF